MSYFSAVTYRITGSVATAQTLFTLANTDPSVLVYVRRINVMEDATAALTAVMPTIRCSRTTALPTGGFILSKSQYDTNNSSSVNVIPRGPNSGVDGNVSTTPITALVSQSVWQTYVMRLHTNNYGQVVAYDNDGMPVLVETQNFILRQNQAIMVQVTSSATTSNPVTNHYIVQAAWEEI